MKRLFLLIVVIWAAIGIPYLFRTPYYVRSNDVPAHLGFVQVLAKEHRLPTNAETYQSWQPPLFYEIAARLAPSSPNHTAYVRLLSWATGILFLLAILMFMVELKVPPLAVALALAFLVTTPKFVMVFTSYNNDILANTLGVWIVYLVWQLRKKWSTRLAWLLFILAAAAINTKLTMVTLFASLAVLLVIDAVLKPRQRQVNLKLAGLGLAGLLTILPWMALHNLPASGSLLPTPFAMMPEGMRFYRSPITILEPPGLKIGQWATPFLYQPPITGLQWKGQNFWSAVFVTSIYGENAFSKPAVWVFWTLDALYLLALMAAIWATGLSNKTKWFGYLFGLGILFFILYPLSAPYISNMDWRYIAWAWLPLTLLWAVATQKITKSGRLAQLGLAVFLVTAIILNLAVVFTAQSCCW